ncbi:hypothetical protein Q767_15135 [Flavobacterium enshiense DK69]|uniref:Uncharacterized protein n=1 Tax=Flavobacterium enshiense DK69 TaxID=1107311 RepID=A0A0A2MKE7_9FLAO|nr:hypothetical protein Q767_15135 [Flavobacterium enshiense DK69]
MTLTSRGFVKLGIFISDIYKYIEKFERKSLKIGEKCKHRPLLILTVTLLTQDRCWWEVFLATNPIV